MSNEEVPRQGDADEWNARAPRHLAVEAREEDRHAASPLEHTIEEAVCRVVIVFVVAAKSARGREHVGQGVEVVARLLGAGRHAGRALGGRAYGLHDGIEPGAIPQSNLHLAGETVELLFNAQAIDARLLRLRDREQEVAQVDPRFVQGCRELIGRALPSVCWVQWLLRYRRIVIAWRARS